MYDPAMDELIARREVRLGSRTVSYLAAGPPEPTNLIVFLHAFPLSAEMWRPQLMALPAGWSAVAPDFRGFGESTPDEPAAPRREDAGLEDYAADVAGLLDMIGVSRGVFCGCSMGGYTLLSFLRRCPQRVAGMVLADTRATADTDSGRAGRFAMLELLDREGPPAIASQMRSKLVGTTSRASRPSVVAAIDSLMRTATPSGVGHAVVRMLNRPGFTADLAAFRGPVLVVVGEEDELTPPAESELMAGAVPGASFVRIPEAGHLSNLEAPDTFNAVLHELLAAVSRANV